jgi:hypothetical protein
VIPGNHGRLATRLSQRLSLLDQTRLIVRLRVNLARSPRPQNLVLLFQDSTYFASSLLLAEPINSSRGWKILAVMLLSQLVIEVQSDTFVEQRNVLW